jgi:hypothetical protein
MFCQSQLIMPISMEKTLDSKDRLVSFEKIKGIPEIGDGDNGATEHDYSGRGGKPSFGNETSGQAGSSDVQRYLPPGWCALLCKIKHQRIVKWDALNQNMLQVESCLSEGKQVETTRTVQKYFPCNNNTMVPTPSPSIINQWKPYLRPILSSSRPNLWKRKDESLVERNQLP